ncbi:MAG: tRNA (adenosine(37)-N6)-threonylcarbamoyltransferase complex transferase subunit TsaD [Deltaproteobacteria bacterium CG11_big_fil_rev_8_21_14_0_20_47_16]|nr:MAG: tRNA (adenosine(37)-N6)-threonylcarbamoyltransferase complex transferase subunit TsaD [Deltaproteobacteria bacterium CG11_big_fil_rev_8_21_14_0_20_47_16]
MILAFESSCDETAVAILAPPRQLRASLVASQHEIHIPFGGVVPELAARRHMEVIVPLYQDALVEAGITLDDVTGIAATCKPGLIGALLVGLSFAKSLAMGRNLPFIGVNHIEGHLNAVHLEHDDVPYPHLGVVVSGGHTEFYIVKGFADYQLLGATRDDAAGEAFDKVAKLLNLGYPGGPIVDKRAALGNPKAIRFSLPKMSESSKFGIGKYDVSFSGLKTAVALWVKQNDITDQPLSADTINDLVASFQYTAVEILMRSVSQIVTDHNLPAVVVSGGVAANSALRKAMTDWGIQHNVRTYFPSMKLCVDNAAMIAYVGSQYLARGVTSNWDLNATASGAVGILT